MTGKMQPTIPFFGIYDTKEFVEFIFLPHELFGIA